VDIEPVNANADEHCAGKVDKSNQKEEDLRECNPGTTALPPTVQVRTTRVHAHVDEAAENNKKDVGGGNPPPNLVESTQALGEAIVVTQSSNKEQTHT
jgi:hypothetical protein